MTLSSSNVLPTPTTPTASDLGWLGGFLDGEGCVFVTKQRYKDPARNTTLRLGVCIEQNDRSVLQHFLTVLGVHGVIYDKKMQPNHRRQCFRLNYSGEHAMKVVRALLPVLVRKRLEAIAALQFWHQGQAGRRFGPAGCPPAVMAIRLQMYAKLRSLK